MELIQFIITEASRRLPSNEFQFIIHDHGKKKKHNSAKQMKAEKHILNMYLCFHN
jgi:hypothetical protein